MNKLLRQITAAYTVNKFALLALVSSVAAAAVQAVLLARLADLRAQWRTLNPSGISGISGDAITAATRALESSATVQATILYGFAVLLGMGAIVLGLTGVRQVVYRVASHGTLFALLGTILGLVILAASTSTILTGLVFGLHYYR